MRVAFLSCPSEGFCTLQDTKGLSAWGVIVPSLELPTIVTHETALVYSYFRSCATHIRRLFVPLLKNKSSSFCTYIHFFLFQVPYSNFMSLYPSPPWDRAPHTFPSSPKTHSWTHECSCLADSHLPPTLAPADSSTWYGGFPFECGFTHVNNSPDISNFTCLPPSASQDSPPRKRKTHRGIGFEFCCLWGHGELRE